MLLARMDKSIEKLASGEMINRAGVDASGLAVSEKIEDPRITGLILAENTHRKGLHSYRWQRGFFTANDIMSV
jgi:hypothetical protein